MRLGWRNSKLGALVSSMRLFLAMAKRWPSQLAGGFEGVAQPRVCALAVLGQQRSFDECHAFIFGSHVAAISEYRAVNHAMKVDEWDG